MSDRDCCTCKGSGQEPHSHGSDLSICLCVNYGPCHRCADLAAAREALKLARGFVRHSPCSAMVQHDDVPADERHCRCGARGALAAIDRVAK